MCCHVRIASVSRRRRAKRRQYAPPTLPTLITLDLSNPAERQAHDFLCRATSKGDRMWRLIRLRRHRDTLLCLVRWIHPDNKAKPFSLAEVSLTETAVCWRDYATPEDARAEMDRHFTATPSQDGIA